MMHYLYSGFQSTLEYLNTLCPPAPHTMRTLPPTNTFTVKPMKPSDWLPPEPSDLSSEEEKLRYLMKKILTLKVRTQLLQINSGVLTDVYEQEVNVPELAITETLKLLTLTSLSTLKTGTDFLNLHYNALIILAELEIDFGAARKGLMELDKIWSYVLQSLDLEFKSFAWLVKGKCLLEFGKEEGELFKSHLSVNASLTWYDNEQFPSVRKLFHALKLH